MKILKSENCRHHEVALLIMDLYGGAEKIAWYVRNQISLTVKNEPQEVSISFVMDRP